jgi:hypothetical protein
MKIGMVVGGTHSLRPKGDVIGQRETCLYKLDLT